MKFRTCLKCSHRYNTPRYEAYRDILVYTCVCGFRWTEPTDEKPTPTPTKEDE